MAIARRARPGGAEGRGRRGDDLHEVATNATVGHASACYERRCRSTANCAGTWRDADVTTCKVGVDEFRAQLELRVTTASGRSLRRRSFDTVVLEVGTRGSSRSRAAPTGAGEPNPHRRPRLPDQRCRTSGWRPAARATPTPMHDHCSGHGTAIRMHAASAFSTTQTGHLRHHAASCAHRPKATSCSSSSRTASRSPSTSSAFSGGRLPAGTAGEVDHRRLRTGRRG